MNSSRRRVQPTVEGMGRAMDWLAALLVRHGATEQERYDAVLVLDELLANLVRHARPLAGHLEVSVAVRLEPGRLELEVRDTGASFDPRSVPAPDLDAPLERRRVGGLGLFLVRALSDDLEWRRERGQNVVVVRRRLAG